MNSILDTVGNTPIVRLHRLSPEGFELFAKLEAFNPLGSVKDRLALGVIEAAERSGLLKPGQTVVEATSGNTGIGLAMVCARKGYPLVIVMAESFSVERRRLMRFLGARVVLTPASEKGTGMVAKARELAATHGWFWTRQFENEANADIHSRTTAQEILRDFGGTGPDYFVTGAGTGGTLKGVARVLRSESPATRIIVAEPENAPILASGVGQRYQEDGTPAESHPMFRPHPVQGWSPGLHPPPDRRCDRREVCRRHPARGRCGIVASGPRARAARGYLLRHLRRCDPGRGDRGRRRPPRGGAGSCSWFPTPASAISRRHFRGDRAGDGRRGARDLELDAALPVRRSAAGRRTPRSPPTDASAAGARLRRAAIADDRISR